VIHPLPNNYEKFVELVDLDLNARAIRNKTYYEKRAFELGITNKNTVKELTELAITRNARAIAHHEHFSIYTKFKEIVRLYEGQVNLSHRTSQSMLLQQYSTPAPISYLAGIFAGAYSSVSVFEPCAGNGLLTIAARPQYTTVNEIDAVRKANLESQGYRDVLSQDAGEPFVGFEKKFESILTNPPFGRLDEAVNFGTFGIKTLEHMMVINALNCMADHGRAAVIVGGHATYDAQGRIRKGANRIFLNYLYHHYNVVDVVNVNGKKLYSRQGTAFDVRLILIDGRKKHPEGHALLFDAEREKPLSDFDVLYKRLASAHQRSMKTYEMTVSEYSELRRQIDSLAPPRGGDWSKRLEKYKAEHQELIQQHAQEGYHIEFRVKQEYPDLLLSPISSEPTMKNSDEDIERQADELARLLQDEINGNSLKGIGKEELYLMQFSQQDPPSKYAAYGKFYNRKQAQRFAQNIVNSFLDQSPPLVLTVDSVRPWIEWFQLNGLGAPYMPTSDGCFVLDTVVPDSMSFETHEALAKVKEAVGGDIDEFVRNRLGYPSKIELCKALAAEQIDAVALAIYNVEARKLDDGKGQGMIIGDQTGIGKGRIAAAMIRYGTKRGMKPVFLTEKPNLFTDLYRDLKAIGSPHLVPFIINARDAKSNVLDEYGDKVYSALDPKEQDAIFASSELPSVYDFVMATYTQFNSPNKPKKREFLMRLAENNLLVLDEAHNASGSGNTGQFIQLVVSVAQGVLFLSATFAKRPDNMPLYAMKTVLRESNMNKDELVLAIRKGGVALQEVIASELVKEGQMLRRERSSEGVEVNYISLDELEEKHLAISDSITEIIRDIIDFQKNHITTEIDKLDEQLAKSQKQAQVREGTQRAGADNLPYFSKVFQVIGQMLFAIKAESVADRAIMRLKEGKKPVIAFSNTMGSFIETIESVDGGSANEGDIINADFSEVLRRGLEGINRYSVVDIDGNQSKEVISIESLGANAQLAYQRIVNKIETISTGITISPIDVIVEKIRKAGYSVAEVTGRKYELELFVDEGVSGLGELDKSKNKFPVNIQNLMKKRGRFGGRQLLGKIKLRKRMVTNEAFRKFNNNEIDVLMINQAGSTGASAHAVPTSKVPASEVKQRVMLVLQAELDISTEVQKRGRINRTGQIFKPIYDYVTSAIPAEQRLMMMLQSKLKSLDANTTSNQKQSKKILDVPDFLNKYGDHLVNEYLEDNPDVNMLLDEPLESETYSVQEPALKVSGRVAVLSTKMQREFYNEMTTRYNEYIEYLKQTGEYDLELEKLELKAKTLNAESVIMGKGGASTFGTDSMLEEVEVDVLRKPMRYEELNNAITEALSGQTSKELQAHLLKQYQDADTRHLSEIAAVEQQYDEILQNLPEEKWLKKVLDLDGEQEYKRQLEEEQKKHIQVREEKIEKIFNKHADLSSYLKRIFGFFYVGRNVNYVHRLDDEGERNEQYPAVFLGFVIDMRKKNPFALSNIKLRFAIASGLRYLALPASNRVDISSIQGESSGLKELELSELSDYWQSAIASRMKNRETRYIVTGNILQGLGKFLNGRLINYTTDTGTEKKGIFMPESWDEEAQGAEGNITVPASKALPIIKSLGEGHEMVIGKNISIFRHKGDFKLIVPAAASSGGEIYKNHSLLAIVDDHNFNKVSTTMVTVFKQRDLESVLKILERDIGTNVTVSRTEFKYIKDYFPEALLINNFPKLEMLSEEVQPVMSNDDLVAEAEALLLIQELELEMLQMELSNE